MFLAGLFMKLGAAQRLAQALSIATVAIALVLALWWVRADAYGDGERAADARYTKASLELERKAQRSATKADDAAARRTAEHFQIVEREKERLDEADRTGSSPLDVLFNP